MDNNPSPANKRSGLTPFLLRDGVARVWQVDRAALQTLRAEVLAVEGIGFYAAVAYLPLADVVIDWLAAPNMWRPWRR